MAKFLLTAGSWITGQGKNRKVYNHAKPGENVVESEINLAAKHPEKFKPLVGEEGPYQYNPAANKKSSMPALTPTTGLQVDKKGKSLDDRYGNLDDLTVAELKQIAEAEEVDVKSHTKKEDIVKSLRAGTAHTETKSEVKKESK